MPADKHSRRAPHNTKSMNDFVSRREVLAMLRNVGLIDDLREPCAAVLERRFVNHQGRVEALERRTSYLEALASHKPQPWYRRLWARLRRQA